MIFNAITASLPTHIDSFATYLFRVSYKSPSDVLYILDYVIHVDRTKQIIKVVEILCST